MWNLFRLIFFSCIAICGPAYGQNNPAIKKRSEVILNYPDSTVKANILLANFEKPPKSDRVYYWFYQDQINKNVGGYSGRILDGRYTVFDLGKNLITEGMFKKGLKHGTWKKWLNKGGLLSIEEYKNGLKHGRSYQYDRTGKLISMNQYRFGKKNGKCIIYKNDSAITHKFHRDIEILHRIKEKNTSLDESNPAPNSNTNKDNRNSRNIKSNKSKMEQKIDSPEKENNFWLFRKHKSSKEDSDTKNRSKDNKAGKNVKDKNKKKTFALENSM
jgi:antitoxin component YwqK of YwqJK toxin-antitoxin module